VDVYALCATLYALLAGRPPRWPVDRMPTLTTLMELFDQPVPEINGVPPELTTVLRAGMANDPATRPTAERLRDLLAAVPLGQPGGAPANPPDGREWPPQPPPQDTPTVPTHRPPWTVLDYFRRR
jgi:hypothetical protein